MNSSDNTTTAKTNYVLVPATIVEDSPTDRKPVRYIRGIYGFPMEQKLSTVDSSITEHCTCLFVGYICGYTDFTSELGKRMVKQSIMPKLLLYFVHLTISEFIFSETYLNFDKFIRPFMDVEGFFPIFYLLCFPAIQAFGVDVVFIADILGDCSFADVDMSCMTIRPKNWEKWILPNQMGGFGVPRYTASGDTSTAN